MASGESLRLQCPTSGSLFQCVPWNFEIIRNSIKLRSTQFQGNVTDEESINNSRVMLDEEFQRNAG
jgi:hypothetical protein